MEGTTAPPAAPTPAPDATSDAEATGKIVAWIGAAVLLGAWIVMTILQFDHTAAEAEEWTRRLQLLSPLENLAFAGAGVLLGTTVQRGATKKAEEVADANQEDAAAGRAMQAAAQAKVDAPRIEAPPEVKELLLVAEEAKKQ